jgi:hypothetical protein
MLHNVTLNHIADTFKLILGWHWQHRKTYLLREAATRKANQPFGYLAFLIALPLRITEKMRHENLLKKN